MEYERIVRRCPAKNRELRYRGARQLQGELENLRRDLATVYIGLGDKDSAFMWLNKAYEERSGWLTYIAVEPRLDSPRSNPRFDDLMRRVGF